MKYSRDLACQQGTSAALWFLAGSAVYLGCGNELGLAKLPALLIALVGVFVLLKAYRSFLKPGISYCVPGVLLCLSGGLIIIGWLYCGILELWLAATGYTAYFWLYAALPLILFPLVALRGKISVMRCGPLLCFLLLITVLLDTVFSISRMDISLLIDWKAKQDMGFGFSLLQIFLCFAAPGVLMVWENAGKKDEQVIPAAYRGGIWAAAGYLVLQLLRDLLLFGDMISLDKYPVLRTLRSVDIGVGISRLEFFGLIFLGMVVLAGIMLCFHTVNRTASALCGKKQWLPVLIQTAAVYLLSLAFHAMQGGRLPEILGGAGCILVLTGTVVPCLIKAGNRG